MNPQRFRKRDRFLFHGKKFMRRMSDNVGTLKDPNLRKRAIKKLTKNFLKWVKMT